MQPRERLSTDRRLRSQRPAKPQNDVWLPLGVQEEKECTPEGALESCLTIFLAGRECPFTCIFCDLWRYTTDDPTPAGAIPAQIRAALAGPDLPDVLKLYNASNFFDAKAVPSDDDAEILELVRGIPRIVVECHAKLIDTRCAEFAARLRDQGSRLEVAMGFETVHEAALEKLNKKVTVRDLRFAAAALADMDADLRAFILIGVPFIPDAEQLDWVERSVETALESGARLVSLIPLRGVEGEIQRLRESGEWLAPTLDLVEASYERTRVLCPERVRLDTWDLESLAQNPDEKKRVRELEIAQLKNTSGDEAPTESHPGATL